MHEEIRMWLQRAACLVQHIKFAVQLPKRYSERRSQHFTIGEAVRLPERSS